MSEEHHTHEKVHAFLKHHPMGVLSTVSPEGEPWGAAIYYVADKDFNVYFVTRAKTAKFANLVANPLAALTIADQATQTTVQLVGKVAPLPPARYVEIVFNELAKAYPKDDVNWIKPIDQLHAGNYMPMYIVPTKLQYADYGKKKTDFHKDSIEHIIG